MRTAPAPNIPPIPGMCPSIAVLAGGGDGGGGSGDSAKSGGGKESADAKQGGQDAADDSRSATKGAPDYKKFPECGYASHPVDVVTARAFTHPMVDFELGGPLPFEFSRMYSSKMADRDAGLGFGWGHTLGWEIEVSRRTVTVWNEQGIAVDFPMINVGDDVLGPWGWVLRRETWGFAVDADDGTWRLFSETFDGGRIYKLTAIEDRNKNRVGLTYDDGRLVELTDSAGRVVRVKSTPDGHIASFELMNAVSNGRWVPLATYSYDDRGDLVRASDADRHAAEYAYADDHRLALDTDRAGLCFHFLYDDKGRCVESWGDYPGRTDPSLDDNLPKYLADGTTRVKGIHHCRFSWFPDGYSEVADSTQVRRFYGNKHGTLDKAVEGGGVLTCRYDAAGFLIARTDAVKGTTTFELDRRGRILEVTDAGGHVTQIERDAAGLPIRVRTPAGGDWIYERDRFGNVTRTVDPAGYVTTIRYDSRGLPTEVVDVNGGKTTFTYDAQGNVASITQPNGGTYRYAYDVFGRCVSVTDPLGGTTRAVFTERGDLVAIHDALGGVVRYAYDGERHLVSEVAPSGASNAYIWGGYHKLAQRRDANGNVVRLCYNLEGELLRVVNARGEEHRFEYDSTGFVIGEQGFGGEVTRYKNDALGRAVRIENGAGQSLEILYGPMGEVLERTHDDDSKETFVYDPMGALVEAAGPAGTFRFERDALGRLVREVQLVGDEEHVVENEYDPIGERIVRRTSLGHVERIERDELGSRKRTVLDGGFEILHRNDLVGREIERVLPGGAHLASVFDAEGRLGRRRVTSAIAHRPLGPGEPEWIGPRDQGITVDKTYRYDWDGELIESADGKRGATTFEYDPVGQLVSTVPPKARALVFVYDAAGNVSEATTETKRGYERGRLVRKGDTTYAWDGDGRLTERRTVDRATLKESVFRYRWDARGMLARVETPKGEIVEFSYDPFARRMQKKVSRVPGPGEKPVALSLTRFVWDGDRLVHEIKKTARRGGDPVIDERTYCFEDWSSRPSAHRDARKDDVAASTGWFTYVNDPSGMPDTLVAPDGQVACELDRDAWGHAEIGKGPRTSTPLRLQGQYEDAETGLSYNRFRYYDPDAGRYIAPDPMGLEGGLEPYALGANTLGWIDPMGLKRKRPDIAAKARGWQGKGNYPGVDAWGNTVIPKGTVIVAGEPGVSGYFTTPDAVRKCGHSRKALGEGTQVAPHPVHGYRPKVGVYVTTADITVAAADTKANPHLGKGGLPQMYCPHWKRFTKRIGEEPLGP